MTATITWGKTDAVDEVRLRVLLHGESGAGKTYIARTVPDPSRALVVLCEDGGLSLADINMTTAKLAQSSDLEALCVILRGERGRAIDWLIIDSLSAWADMVLAEELAKTSNSGNQNHGMRAYGAMQDRVKAWLHRTMPTLPQHVLCTAKQERVQTDEGQRLVPYMPGRTLTHKSPVAHDFDAVWCLHVVKGAEGEPTRRLLQTQADADPACLAKTRDPWGRIKSWEAPDLASLAARMTPTATTATATTAKEQS